MFRLNRPKILYQQYRPEAEIGIRAVIDRYQAIADATEFSDLGPVVAIHRHIAGQNPATSAV